MSINSNVPEVVTIRLRRDTSANWVQQNPVLKLGEPGVETDTRKLKFGDGTTVWINLPYAGVDTDSPILLENIDDRVASLIKAGSNVSIDYDDEQNFLTISSVAAPVQSVSGKTGIVNLNKGDVGLGDVDNTSDSNKPISSATQTALNLKSDITHNHDALYRKIEYITLSHSSIPAPITAVKDREYIIRDNSGFVGPITVSNFVINDPVGGSVGDGYVVYKPSYTFHNVVIGGVTYSNTSSFYIYRYLYINNITPTWKTVFFSPVQSVAGKTGIVTLTKSDVGLNNVDNTTDANKPVSIAQQSALDGKVSSNTGVVPNSVSITNIVSISQANYDALVTKDSSTLYVIS